MGSKCDKLSSYSSTLAVGLSLMLAGINVGASLSPRRYGSTKCSLAHSLPTPIGLDAERTRSGTGLPSVLRSQPKGNSYCDLVNCVTSSKPTNDQLTPVYW